MFGFRDFVFSVDSCEFPAAICPSFFFAVAIVPPHSQVWPIGSNNKLWPGVSSTTLLHLQITHGFLFCCCEVWFQPSLSVSTVSVLSLHVSVFGSQHGQLLRAWCCLLLVPVELYCAMKRQTLSSTQCFWCQMGRSSRDGVGEGRQQYALAPMVGGTVGEMDLSWPESPSDVSVWRRLWMALKA